MTTLDEQPRFQGQAHARYLDSKRESEAQLVASCARRQEAGEFRRDEDDLFTTRDEDGGVLVGVGCGGGQIGLELNKNRLVREQQSWRLVRKTVTGVMH